MSIQQTIQNYIQKWTQESDQERADQLKTAYPLDEYIRGGGFYLLPADPRTSRPVQWDPVQTRVKNDIQTIIELRKCQEQGIRQFYIIPRDTGYFILHIDRKDGKDGLEYLREWDPDFIPRVFVTTPNRGYHIYFSVDKELAEDLPKNSGILAPGIGYIFDHHPATAAGSITGAGEYNLYGRFDRVQCLENHPAFRDRILNNSTNRNVL